MLLSIISTSDKQMSNKYNKIEKNTDLEKLVKKLEKKISDLKSENKTLKQAWKKTQQYVEKILEQQGIEDILHDIETKTNLTKVKSTCPKCKHKKMHKRNYGTYSILTCDKCKHKIRKK